MAMQRLRSTRTKEQHLVLSAPATVALAIDEAGIQWPEDRPLRVALLETSTYEFLDDGQWYRFVPAMLGSQGTIEVHAYGRTPASARTSKVTKILNQRYRISARWTEKSLTRREEPASCDLALSFSGMTGGADLLEQLVTISQIGAPLYVTSFSSTHALLNHAILRAHGANASPVVAANPFGLVSKRVGENWNRVLSKVPVEALPLPGARIDAEYLDSLDITAAMVLQSHRLGDPSQTWAVGSVVDGSVVHTLDGIAVNTATRDVVDLNAQRVLGQLSQRFDDAVTDYSDEWDETDKLLWASHIRYFAMAEGMTGGDHGGAAA